MFCDIKEPKDAQQQFSCEVELSSTALANQIDHHLYHHLLKVPAEYQLKIIKKQTKYHY